MNTHHTTHRPVLPQAVLDVLQPKQGESYLDLTAGYGGHAQVVLAKTKQPDKAVLVDRDQDAINALGSLARSGASLIHSDFVGALANLDQTFDLILMDLGVSSAHFDKAERGFSFSKPGPLDMRMDQTQDLTANTIVNTWAVSKLTELIKAYGEESPNSAARIADSIVRYRPLKDTQQLAQAVTKAVGSRKSKIHPATKTFQAIRIAVNDELGQLEQALPLALSHLEPHGRFAVISFHSLEDRIVKRFFREESSGYTATIQLLTKRAVTNPRHAYHPRARSAKLRAVVKINKERSA